METETDTDELRSFADAVEADSWPASAKLLRQAADEIDRLRDELGRTSDGDPGTYSRGVRDGD